MCLADLLHPPAGADPIVVILGASPWMFLLVPVLVGAIAIVLLGTGYHHWISRKSYPLNRIGLFGFPPSEARAK